MLGVTFTDAPVAGDSRKQKKKHKKDKKKHQSKHHKEHHSRKRDGTGSSSDDDGSGGSEPEGDAGPQGPGLDAAAAASPAPAAQREEWMSAAEHWPGHAELMKKEEAKLQVEAEAAKAAAAEPEIVPGLRIMKPSGGAPGDAPVTSRSGGGTALPAAALVGDGGLSWRLKALKRAQAQAAASGQDVAAVVADRWGSLQDLTASLTKGQAADARAHLHASRHRERTLGPVSGGPSDSGGSGRPPSRGAHYLSDLRSGSVTPQMKKPSMDDSLSFRRRGASERSGGGSGGPGGSVTAPLRPVSPFPGGQVAESPAEDGDKQGAGRAEGDRPGRRPEEGGRQDGVAPDRHREGRERRGDPGGGSGKGDRHHHHHDRDKGGADRQREGRTDRRGLPPLPSRPDDRHGPPGGPRANADQTDALAGVAAAFNSHASDGSFMSRFQQQHQRESQQALDHPPRSRTPVSGRAVDQAAADAMREEMRRLRSGMDGGGADEDVDDDAPLGGPAHRPHAEMEVGGVRSGSDSDGRPPAPRAERGDRSSGGAASRRDRSPPPPAPALANKSVAEMMRARLKGLAPPAPRAPPMEQSNEPEAAGNCRGAQPPPRDELPEGRRGGREVVALPMVDAAGRAVRGAFGREATPRAPADASQGGRPPKRTQRYDESGEKVRYFNDDDVDLDTLVKRTKYGDDHDAALDRTVVQNIARKARFKQAEVDVDAEYDHDAGLELYEERAKKGNAEQQAARERARQVAAYQRAQRAENQCLYCPGNARRPAHLTIAAGNLAYLMLPPRGRLTPGHCCIVPKDHISSMRLVDDDVWTEVKNFVKCLVQMFGSQGKDVLFWETATSIGGPRRHAVLEAVPLTGREMAQAPGYFKKAMQEAESEWSVHAAKSAIATTAKKGLRESIPPNFPYLYVQFGYGSGFVHVIDDESKYDVQLGRQVVVGLLRLPAEEMHRRQQAESATTQQEWAREFVSQWAPYDWTLQL